MLLRPDGTEIPWMDPEPGENLTEDDRKDANHDPLGQKNSKFPKEVEREGEQVVRYVEVEAEVPLTISRLQLLQTQASSIHRININCPRASSIHHINTNCVRTSNSCETAGNCSCGEADRSFCP